MSKMPQGLSSRRALAPLEHMLVRKDGPLTRDLLQKPGNFGLGRLPARINPDATTTMVCGFCSTGCSLTAHLKREPATGSFTCTALTPTAGYPVNLGMACPKGWEALTPLKGPGRAATPLLREDGKLRQATWDEALAEMTQRFKAVQAKYGPEAVAWLGTGQLPTEELAFLGALAKFGMGIVHGDGNTRQCMATAAVAYKQAFGFDAPPFTYDDFEQSDVIVLVGSNLCIAHPIMWERICRNPHNPRIVVIDPRTTETAVAATHHYAPHPKSDLTLLYAVAHWLVENDRVDRAYIERCVSGYDAWRQAMEAFTLERAARETGLSPEQIIELATLIADGKRVSLWWTMGVNQSHQGVRTAQALINLALITGNMGRPGTGANSITGQCNAMGSRLFSNTTNLLGGRDFGNPTHRQEVADILQLDESAIPSQASLAYDQILEGILKGKIKALWVIATNPAHSWINQNHLQEVLSRLDCLVVQDMYDDTETALLADIVLPAAAWGEKEGTFINSERRIGVLKKVSVSPGEALADFHIFQLVAEAWGCGNLFRRWTSPEAVFGLLKELSRGRPCDITGIQDYAHVERAGGLQWPFPEGSEALEQQRRLFVDGRFFTESGKAELLFTEPQAMPERTTHNYPLLLLTGRGSSSQWHTQTRTKRSDVLQRLSPAELYVEISPRDARSLQVKPNETVTVSSQRGSLTARAFVTNGVQEGHVFLPMHYHEVNRLTFPAFDPHSRQPSYKACAVRVERMT